MSDREYSAKVTGYVLSAIVLVVGIIATASTIQSTHTDTTNLAIQAGKAAEAKAGSDKAMFESMKREDYLRAVAEQQVRGK